MKSYTHYGSNLFQFVMSVFTHTWTATYLLSWVTIFYVDALWVVLFSFIYSCQAPSFLFDSEACPFSHFSFSPWASYPSVYSFFCPYKKKAYFSSVLLSPLISLISVQFFSHLERDSPDPKICPPKKAPPCMVLYPLVSVPSLVHQFVQSISASISENLWRKSKTFNETFLLLWVAFFLKIYFTWTLLFLFMWYWIHNTYFVSTQAKKR